MQAQAQARACVQQAEHAQTRVLSPAPRPNPNPNPALELELVDVVVCDAPFIGLATVLPAAMALGADGCRLVALIKPQFEVGKGNVGKGGIVRDPALHRAVCERILAWLDDPDGRHAAERAGLSGRSPHGHGPCPRASPPGRRGSPGGAAAPRAAPRLVAWGGGVVGGGAACGAGRRRGGRRRGSLGGAAARRRRAAARLAA
eukprot:tig00000403_g313.t1